jgi:hypothetical protein
MALSLCKPCDLIFLVHVVLVVGHLNADNSAAQKQTQHHEDTSRHLIHGCNNEAEAKAAYLADKYKKLGYNLHIEKVAT